MEVFRNNEEKVMCPYNSSHYIRKYRMEAHLTKCRKSYRESEVLMECDFNACHRIPQAELQYHHDTCPDRKALELQIFTEEKPVCGPIPSRPLIPVPVDESWDDVDVPSYDPQKYCEENNVLRHLDTASASKRRDFRMAERHRLNNLSTMKNTTSQPDGQAPKEDKKVSLPPTPAFSSNNVEQPPDNVIEMLKKFSMRPKRAVVSKQK